MAEFKKIAQSVTSKEETKKEVLLKTFKKENIIFIGSESYYDSFWLKMMFISAAHVFARDIIRFRPADRKVVAYVDQGYTYEENLAIEMLRDSLGFDVVKLEKTSDVINLLNTNRENFKLQDVAFFSHGKVGAIEFNYWGRIRISIDNNSINQVRDDAFGANGRIYSYACRTGVGVDDLNMGFKCEDDAKPVESLAQNMANRFKVEVHAFLRRSFYGSVIRVKSDSDRISNFLKTNRENHEGQIIKIPPEHEALPHQGLADGSLNPWSGPRREGTHGYALWRMAGGIQLPISADTPTGLPIGMRIFRSIS